MFPFNKHYVQQQKTERVTLQIYLGRVIGDDDRLGPLAKQTQHRSGRRDNLLILCLIWLLVQIL